MADKQQGSRISDRPEDHALATVYERMLVEAEPAYGCVDAEVVQRTLGLRSLFLAERLLVALAGPKRSFDTVDDFIAAAEEIMAAPITAKIDYLFRLHDEDGDGYIQPRELERYLHIAAAEHDLQLDHAEIDELVEALIEAADRDRDGQIGLHELVRTLTERPSVERKLSEYGVALLRPGKRARLRSLLPAASFRGWVRNDLLLSLWIGAYALATLVLFYAAFHEYRAAGANLAIQLARGFGAALNLSVALLAVPMLRRTLAALRHMPLGAAIPIDDAIDLHRMLGEITFVLTLGHTAAHAANVALTSAPLATRANVTGLVMLVALCVLWFFSRERVRRSRRFELFHAAHLGYFVVVGLLFVHGPHFWIWGTVPWLWFLAERTLRTQQRRRRSRLISAVKLASGVTRVAFDRPHGFWYLPGDYVFLNIPSIARHEWHPFTLSSPPEDPSQLSVHVRDTGNWTQALREQLPERIAAGDITHVHVDGPYATCTRHMLAAQHVVAIAGGIGVTPFASILESLLLRQADPDDPMDRGTRVRKLHFVWLCREQRAFEWFRDLLAELERRDPERKLDVHIFMTSGRADMAGGLLDFARSLVMRRRQSASDLVTGLRSRTSLGSPDFDHLLESFYDVPGLPRPEVFFCGPKPLERVVATSCKRLGLRLRAERF